MLSILEGNGDGTFRVNATLAALAGIREIELNDFNGDGNADIAYISEDTDRVVVHLSNGNGSYKAGVSYQVGEKPSDITATDLNGDAILDLAITSSEDWWISAAFGLGMFL